MKLTAEESINFINILRAIFSYESAAQISLVTFQLCNFLATKYWRTHKMLMKLTQIDQQFTLKPVINVCVNIFCKEEMSTS